MTTFCSKRHWSEPNLIHSQRYSCVMAVWSHINDNITNFILRLHISSSLHQIFNHRQAPSGCSTCQRSIFVLIYSQMDSPVKLEVSQRNDGIAYKSLRVHISSSLQQIFNHSQMANVCSKYQRSRSFLAHFTNICMSDVCSCTSTITSLTLPVAFTSAPLSTRYSTTAKPP